MSLIGGYMQYDFLGMGSAVVDKIICVDDAFIEKMGLVKGGTRNLLNVDHQKLIELTQSKNILSIPGGSAANATKIVAGLGDLKCSLLAKIGNDKWGEFYQKNLEHKNIHPFFSKCEKLPTGSMLCLITPDGERTMCPDLRACQSITPKDIQPHYFDHLKLFHIDGYNFYYEEACLQALIEAKKHNCPTSIDFSSFEIIRSHFDMIMELLKKQTFFMIFANEREAFELTGKSDPIDACKALSQFAPISTVMMGEKGAVSVHHEKLFVRYAKAIKPLDTTGAGDMFVGGYIFGHLCGCGPEECLSLGTATAAEGIQVFGGELPAKHLQQLKENIAKLELVIS